MKPNMTKVIYLIYIFNGYMTVVTCYNIYVFIGTNLVAISYNMYVLEYMGSNTWGIAYSSYEYMQLRTLRI